MHQSFVRAAAPATRSQTVDDFEEALAPGGDLRLAIKRMSRGRVVNLRELPAGEGKSGE
jgi:hypothetical protein